MKLGNVLEDKCARAYAGIIVLQHNERGNAAVKFTTLIDELGLDTQVFAARANPRAEVFSFQPFDRKTVLETSIVYICQQELLPAAAPDGTCFLVSAKKPLPTVTALKNANVVFTAAPLLHLLHEAAARFSTEQRLFNDMRRLVLTLDAPSALSQLIETAYQLLQNPIIITDTSNRILGMSREIIPERADLEEQRRQGYLLDTTLADIRVDDLYEKARNSPIPYYSRDPSHDIGWLTCIVYVYGIEAAQVSIMEREREFTRYDMELGGFLAKMVGLELQKDDFYRQNHALMHSVFLSELLKGQVRDARTANVRQKQLGWNLGAEMRALTVFDRNYGAFDRKAQLISGQLHQLIPESRWVIYESKLVFLVPAVAPDAACRALGYLEKNALVAALSDPFSDLLRLRDAYTQCLAAYDLGTRLDPGRTLYRYADYAVRHLGEMAAKSCELSRFYHPAVDKIVEYDRQNGSELLPTLREYLRYVDNPTLVAEHLFIHKNTLFYRIGKIRELFGLDLKNGDERLRVQLTLQLMEL